MRTHFGNPILSLVFLLIVFQFQAVAQSSEQKALEAKKEQLQKEIAEMNRMLFAEKKQRGTVLDQMENLDQKINIRQQLIRVTNQQSNLLNRQINTNIRNITKLREDLEVLKEDYAEMIRKSYQNKSQQSRLMFLLSAQNFYQAYKRLQYLKQYTEYRKTQGEEIVRKTEELASLNRDLTVQRKEKDQLIVENTRARNELMNEIKSQKDLLRTIRQNESKYSAALQAKKKEARQLDRQIERLIRSAIAASNKKANTRGNRNTFALTPEAELVAKSFSANKGKLPWPVEKGIKRQGYGVYKDAVYPGIKHQSNGVIIATDEGAKARAVFEGEVIAILAVPGGNKGVQIKHGNYISTYYNLSDLYVKKGDIVGAQDELGKIYTNRFNGLTQLKFYLYRDATRLNPEEWIYRL
ncbi:MAG: peptidoglycan DD-metalloendopeptidase family protein [Eudoraea sp.]|nr:peptidoglycan DD-metalloendopeptidase family protein [Eudoraea sp.]MBT8311743.1 peptidoglycan DD-metalloendopeptidase family protein [Eudoraea sp.]MBT8322212.1 peptidoglycan DD-metalloendopeptidase family protein [Eudoraea sp.]NNJ38145.1 peptidoglycan DD-metalloendopeptidase family protein [Flavobacteriaceae bacterium]NNJ41563.1 peptidoglycan DD-metalloendopeptidase family protein [Eudoraea sp.]